MCIEMQLKLGFPSDFFVDFSDWQTVVKKVWKFSSHKMLQLLSSWGTVSVPESLLLHEVYFLFTHAFCNHRPSHCPFLVIISSEQWECWLFRSPFDSSDISLLSVCLALRDKPTFTVRQEENRQYCTCMSVCLCVNILTFMFLCQSRTQTHAAKRSH